MGEEIQPDLMPPVTAKTVSGLGKFQAPTEAATIKASGNWIAEVSRPDLHIATPPAANTEGVPSNTTGTNQNAMDLVQPKYEAPAQPITEPVENRFDTSLPKWRKAPETTAGMPPKEIQDKVTNDIK